MNGDVAPQLHSTSGGDGLVKRFLEATLLNPLNVEILKRLPLCDLQDCWLVAGCLFQPIWNSKAGLSADAGINDYDIFYFDAVDLSYEAEDRAISGVRDVFSDLSIKVDVKNQARVHLWYEQRFGQPYPQLRSARDGIDRFLVAGTCVGLSPNSDGPPILYAPYGLDDIFTGKLRPNPLWGPGQLFRSKADSYCRRWPHLVIETT
jgi:uncharacterized protein